MEYVLIGIISDDAQKILLTLKDRPAWQAGKLNLVGGKVEDGELIYDSAVRELFEETGICVSSLIWDSARFDKLDFSEDRFLDTSGLVCNGSITGEGFEVFCYSGFSKEVKIKQRPEETEVVSWYNIEDALLDERLIPNLKSIIPLIIRGVKGWVLNESGV